MKLSEILGWEEEVGEGDAIELPFSFGKTIGFNTALTSCDREIDREALARVIKSSRSLYRWEIRDKQIGDEIKDENEFIAACIISTMPTWLRKVSEK
jgi:hypothetical protein